MQVMGIVAVSILACASLMPTMAKAAAQKDQACVQQCRQDVRPTGGRGGMNKRSEGARVRACIQQCAPARQQQRR
jgi:hypothetical protein